MSWYKRAQANDAGQIILTLLMDAGQGPMKQMENPESRLAGYPPEALMNGLSYAMGIIQNKQSGGLSDGQNFVVQQLQQMISGGGQQKPPQTPQDGLPPIGDSTQSQNAQPQTGGAPPTGNMGHV